MFVINEDNSIYANRGDIVFFSVSAKDNGVPYDFQPGDIVRMAIYGKKNAVTCFMQKDFPVSEVTENVFIYLNEEDTKLEEIISKHKDYWYEIVLNPDTAPQTIVGYDEDGAKLFRLFPESAEIDDDFHPSEEDFPVVDEELDMTSPRPVSNRAIASAVANILDTCERTNEAVAEKFVTPEMFGAVGDGVADDTDAIQTALNSGFGPVDLMGKTYFVSREIGLKDGKSIRNGVLVGNGAARGIVCTSTSTFQKVNIENIVLKNFSEYGIYLKRCANSVISNCVVEDINGESVARGICLEFCKYCLITDCTIHDIIAPDDADGVHFLHQDTTTEEIFSGNVVRNCITYNCTKRHYKIQQFGVTLDGCLLINGEVNVTSCLVAVYDSYATVKNCFFNATASNPIIIGAANDENDHDYRHITISGNRFIHRGSAYQGAIFLANADGCNYRDIIVSDNHFRIVNTTEYALYIRKDFTHVMFNNNIVNGGNSAVCVRDTANGGTLVCNSNQFDGDLTFVYLTNATVDMLSAVGNNIKLGSGDRTVYLAGSDINAGRVENTKEDGVRDYPYDVGFSSDRPTVMLYNGFQYFDQSLQKPIFYYNGNWKDATGANV